uniref:Uncharacterized protein n=1 Tax=Timema bartmani TaxID=61472 RepID=A0A7R9F8X4_9NEOP|nr:unnamed protein product [Timema bartmani]
MEDSGMFQCLAANEAGEGSIYTWLKVKKLYAKPRLRSCASDCPTTVLDLGCMTLANLLPILKVLHNPIHPQQLWNHNSTRTCTVLPNGIQ